jgi:hypothetical protein
MGVTSLSGQTRDQSEWPARSARRDAKSELAQVRAHHGFVRSGRTRTRQLASSPSGAPGTDTPNAPCALHDPKGEKLNGALTTNNSTNQQFVGFVATPMHFRIEGRCTLW